MKMWNNYLLYIELQWHFMKQFTRYDKKRDITFDVLKGVAICSVLIFHILPKFFTPTDADMVRRFIWFFDQYQITLFLFVSGFFFYKSASSTNSTFNILQKKSISLLIPYFIFGSFLFFSKASYLKNKLN